MALLGGAGIAAMVVAFGGGAALGNYLQYLTGKGETELKEKMFNIQTKQAKGQSLIGRQVSKDKDELVRKTLAMAEKQSKDDKYLQMLSLFESGATRRAANTQGMIQASARASGGGY